MLLSKNVLFIGNSSLGILNCISTEHLVNENEDSETVYLGVSLDQRVKEMADENPIHI